MFPLAIDLITIFMRDPADISSITCDGMEVLSLNTISAFFISEWAEDFGVSITLENPAGDFTFVEL